MSGLWSTDPYWIDLLWAQLNWFLLNVSRLTPRLVPVERITTDPMTGSCWTYHDWPDDWFLLNISRLTPQLVPVERITTDPTTGFCWTYHDWPHYWFLLNVSRLTPRLIPVVRITTDPSTDSCWSLLHLTSPLSLPLQRTAATLSSGSTSSRASGARINTPSTRRRNSNGTTQLQHAHIKLFARVNPIYLQLPPSPCCVV